MACKRIPATELKRGDCVAIGRVIAVRASTTGKTLFVMVALIGGGTKEFTHKSNTRPAVFEDDGRFPALPDAEMTSTCPGGHALNGQKHIDPKDRERCMQHAPDMAQSPLWVKR